MLWKKAALPALIGFIIGALISIGFLFTSGASLQDALPHILLGGVYGLVACGSSVIYDIEKWSIARATLTHSLFVFALYFLIVFTMGWFSPEDSVFWIVIAVMAIAYVLIWLIQYLAYKRKIQKMNNDLDRMKSRAGKD